MKPTLKVLSGSAYGIKFSLHEKPTFSIGRDTNNDFVVNDWVTSRNHCLIKNESDGFWIHDLQSHNGTFVNDVRVNEKQLLANGDRIQIGTTYISFSDEDADAFETCNVEFDDLLTTRSDIRLDLYQVHESHRSEMDLLARIGQILNKAQDSEELQRNLLEIIFEIVPANRGAIVLLANGTKEPALACALDRTKRPLPAMRLSRTVTQFVLTQRIALLSNALNNEGLQAAESLVSSRVTSLLCVPLLYGGMKGFLYLDSNDQKFSFEQKHLQQLTALAGIISAAIANAEQLHSLKKENERLQSDFAGERNMIGESPVMKEIFNLLARIARSISTTLLIGESGTGKELAAKAIHQLSERHSKPFVALNCAVLTPNLLETELFGHERGAFTGATTQKKGKFELADGGTIFLDEIGELHPELQAKLLRFLQEREFERVGGTRTIKVDVRVLAATNKNLRLEIERGTYREDLFFRLNVVSVRLPSLRERAADIPLLVEHFLKKYSIRCKRQLMSITEPALAALCAYEWPGNVRELENAIERAVVLTATESIQIEDLPETIVEATANEKRQSPRLYEDLKAARRKIIKQAIEGAAGNYTVAAGQLGIHPNNLHRMAKGLGLKPGK